MTPPSAWWKKGTIYQIYPRSFQDANGDGVGDLPGMVQRLDYCRWLGCDAIWISPIYPSPMADFGYDVSDYTAIDPVFGTMADFDALVSEARRLGLRVLLDLIPNHTSDRHPWFVASRRSRDNPYRDWYIWRDPAPGGGPPNNWQSHFGGPAWTFDAATDQYYLHTYLKEQPDLNWWNLEVRRALYDVMRFWLDRGVDGFRVDAVAHLVKDAQLRDEPPNPDYQPHQPPYHRQLHVYSMDQPELADVLAEMRAVVDAYGDRALIGESYLPIERLCRYYGPEGRGLSFPFNFQLIKTPWDAARVRAAVESCEARLSASMWPNWVLGNHDRARVASRIGRPAARAAAVLLLTLRGTPTLYYGDEIGMVDVPIPPELVQDPCEKNLPGYGVGRDPERTPMQWDAGPSAGFTTGRPWLPVAHDYPTCNVAAQRNDPTSMLTLYRRLLQWRARHPALHLGEYVPVEQPVEQVMAYVRRSASEQFLVAINFRPQRCDVLLAGLGLGGRVRVSTHLDRDGERFAGLVRLRGNEAVLVELGDHR